MLEIANLSKRFGSVAAVDDISFTVQRGEIVSLLGPSGCGKTTTLRLIAGFEHPDSGNIRIDGRDMGDLRPYQRNVGLLFQSYALFPHMTVRDNVVYGLRYHGWTKPKAAERVQEVLGLVKLTGLDGRYPSQLSGGQQQRVALARALATKPTIMLLDEPLSALDAKLRQELRIELKELLRKINATTIIVTHDQEEAMGMAERIVILQHGRIQQDDPPERIYLRPRNQFVAEFVGRSNWLTARCAEKGGTRWRMTTQEGHDLTIPAQQVEAVDFDLAIRPERVDILGESAEPPSIDDTLLTGTVIDVAVLGAERHVSINLEGGHRFLVVEQSRSTSLRAQATVTIRIRAHDWIVLPRNASLGCAVAGS
jgi:putative spermidine/putrescine transport system ATP-binding protein/putrescine transport system ATP-binding protein